MKLLHHIYYHASRGFPDATPAGIICVDLADEVDLTEDASELASICTSVGLFDDSSWQLGFTNEDADLVRGSQEKGNFSYVVANQIVSDWQWRCMKDTGTFRVAEISHNELLEMMGDVVRRFS